MKVFNIKWLDSATSLQVASLMYH